jgi:hypothetical protein
MTQTHKSSNQTTEMKMLNQAPAPNRRQRFPLGGLLKFEYSFCALPARWAAVGEARGSVYECDP